MARPGKPPHPPRIRPQNQGPLVKSINHNSSNRSPKNLSLRSKSVRHNLSLPVVPTLGHDLNLKAEPTYRLGPTRKLGPTLQIGGARNPHRIHPRLDRRAQSLNRP